MTESGPKVNLRGLIRLDDAEDLLSEVVRRLNAQDALIARLFSVIDTLMPADAAKQSLGSLSASVEGLAAEVRAIRSDLVVDVGGGVRLPVSAVVASDHSRVVLLDETVPQLLTRTEAEERGRVAAEHTRQALDELRAWAAPLESLRRLQVASADTAQRLNGVETLVACKVDRAELVRLDELASNLETYRDFKLRTDMELESLRSLTSSHSQTLSCQGEAVAAIREESGRHAARLSALSPKTETRALGRELERQSELIKSLCSAAALIELQSDLSSLTSRVQHTEAGLSQHRRSLDGLADAVELKADRAETMTRLAERERVEALAAVVHSKVDATAFGAEKAAWDGKIANLESDCATLLDRVGVALRFVSWFTERGEVYEHNMRAIDKHLGSLASASVDPRQRPVFASLPAARYNNGTTGISSSSSIGSGGGGSSDLRKKSDVSGSDVDEILRGLSAASVENNNNNML